MDNESQANRRQLLQLGGAVAGAAGAAFIHPLSAMAQQASAPAAAAVPLNMIGSYGPWAASIVGDEPARLSYRRPEFQNVKDWKKLARDRVLEYLLQPTRPQVQDIVTHEVERWDGIEIEHLSWQLPYGPRTKALLLKPSGTREKLPAVLGLHDHGGMKFFGLDKITKTGKPQHPIIVEHQQSDYGGLAWANELSKRGYVVLVHDTFTFGSRRVLPSDLPDRLTRNLPDTSGESAESILAYNEFASEHEHLMAKSLFCSGLTWPGVFVAEDQAALDYLCARPEVDATRIGCAGLSGGGLRTCYLAGIDDRIRCACCVGMMTTWRDYLLNKVYTHTWMIYIPGLPRDLDYPEILAMRVPLPTLVLNNNEDPLFTLAEMKRADAIMSEVFEKAGASEAYQCSYFPGPHKFDRDMQRQAWEWFDRWLV